MQRVALAALLVLGAARAHAETHAPADSTAAVAARDTSAADSAGMSGIPAGLAGRPTTNPALTAVPMARLTGKPRTALRAGPSDADAIVGVYPPGVAFPVLAARGDWINVRLSPTSSGWVHRALCRVYEDLSGLRMQANPRLFTRTGSYSLEGYAGGYAFDRKANSLVLGGRLAYYVFDRLQFETGVAWTHVHRPAEIVESLFGLSLEAEDFAMLSYHLNATYEFLPGRQMVPFATLGAGSSIMQGRSETSFNYGAGTTLFLSKRTGMRWEVRDYAFQSGTDSARRLHHNIEFSLGSLVLF